MSISQFEFLKSSISQNFDSKTRFFRWLYFDSQCPTFRKAIKADGLLTLLMRIYDACLCYRTPLAEISEIENNVDFVNIMVCHCAIWWIRKCGTFVSHILMATIYEYWCSQTLSIAKLGECKGFIGKNYRLLYDFYVFLAFRSTLNNS